MAKRRPRLIPKVVFRVALTATAVPLLGACAHQPAPGVAQQSYGVAQRAYDPEPVVDASQPLLPQPTVAAIGYVTPPPVVDASVDGKTDAAKLDAGAKRDAAAVVGPTLHPPKPGVAYRGYEVEGVAYRGYDLPKASAGPPGTPPTKP